MLDMKEIKTSNDFFSAMDNGYNIYVSTAGKIVAYSNALSSEHVKENISVNPVFIRDTFNVFFDIALHDLIHSEYADALRNFFRKYLETNTHFTLEASNELKRELRTLITAIKTEQIKKLYKILPRNNFGVEDTAIFFSEVAKIPYYILLRITGIPTLAEDCKQYLPSREKMTVEECIKVIDYFAQGFQTEFSETPPTASQGKWGLQHFNEDMTQKKSQKSLGEGKKSTPSTTMYSSPDYSIQASPYTYVENNRKSKEPTINKEEEYSPTYTKEEEHIPTVEESAFIAHNMEEEHIEEPLEHSYESDMDTSSLHEVVSEYPVVEEPLFVGHDTTVEETVEEPLEQSHEVASEYPTVDESAFIAHNTEEETTEESLIQPHEANIENESTHFEEENPDNEYPEHSFVMQEEVTPLQGLFHEVEEEHRELELPYEEHHLLTEEKENFQNQEMPAHIQEHTAYSDILDDEEEHTIEREVEPQHPVLFSYDEFTTLIASLESFVIEHAEQFPEINMLFMNELYTVLAFIAQYHGYAINRQQAKFMLLQHATAVCIRYEEEKSSREEERITILLALALQTTDELHSKTPMSEPFIYLLHFLSANESMIEQYPALNVADYEKALVYASCLHRVQDPFDIETFLLHANTLYAMSLIKEREHNIYSASFLQELATLSFDELQLEEEYYNAYYYQMILFQYGNEYKPYIPTKEYNAHVLFLMIAIVEQIHSYVFTDEEQLAHCGKGILSLLVEAYSLYVNDSSQPFLAIFCELAEQSRNSMIE